jgi:hypothetical protein
MKTLLILLCTFVYVHSSAQIIGCTDPAALNYSSAANINDGSCIYAPAQVTPDTSFILNDTLDETSGLIMWNGFLWTHVDDTDTRLFALDSTNGSIQRRDTMFEVTNVDMEEISQDSEYIYIGDFGNNVNGNRTDLRIYRFSKDSLLNGHASADTISFAYADQTDFNPQGPYNTNFDCEAFIVTDDSIYLFTKQWISFGCKIYAFPKDTGFHFAQPRDSFNVQGLVTGATYLPDQHLITLVGYSPLIQPWLLLLYDYNSTRFFSGNKRKIDIAIGTSQTEAVTTTDGARFYITNEKRTIASTSYPQQLHILDLRIYTDVFIHSGIDNSENHNLTFNVFPNPAVHQLYIESVAGACISICNYMGIMLESFTAEENITFIDTTDWAPGMYMISVMDGENTRVKRVIKL